MGLIHRTITDELLRQILQKIAQVHSELRYVHLSTHLKTPDILESEQITLYNKLRGYYLTILAKMFPKGMIPKCGKSITIVHRYAFTQHQTVISRRNSHSKKRFLCLFAGK